MNRVEVSELAKKLADSSKVPSRYFLFGDVGVGKTYFVSQFVKYLDSTVRVKSPTYSYVNEYNTKKGRVIHIDAYRLSNVEDLESIGFFQYLKDNIYLFVEWSENIRDHIPKDSYLVDIKYIDLDERDLKIRCIS